MAKTQLTKRKQNKIIADYVRTGNYSAAARANKVSPNTVKRLVQKNPDVARMCEEKKRADERDVRAYMDGQKDLVCQIIGNGLKELADPEKLHGARPTEITTAIGTLIDKWAALAGGKQETKLEIAGLPEEWKK